jgi:hypothetical protein
MPSEKPVICGRERSPSEGPIGNEAGSSASTQSSALRLDHLKRRRDRAGDVGAVLMREPVV